MTSVGRQPGIGEGETVIDGGKALPFPSFCVMVQFKWEERAGGLGFGGFLLKRTITPCWRPTCRYTADINLPIATMQTDAFIPYF